MKIMSLIEFDIKKYEVGVKGGFVKLLNKEVSMHLKETPVCHYCFEIIKTTMVSTCEEHGYTLCVHCLNKCHKCKKNYCYVCMEHHDQCVEVVNVNKT